MCAASPRRRWHSDSHQLPNAEGHPRGREAEEELPPTRPPHRRAREQRDRRADAEERDPTESDARQHRDAPAGDHERQDRDDGPDGEEKERRHRRLPRRAAKLMRLDPELIAGERVERSAKRCATIVSASPGESPLAS